MTAVSASIWARCWRYFDFAASCSCTIFASMACLEFLGKRDVLDDDVFDDQQRADFFAGEFEAR